MQLTAQMQAERKAGASYAAIARNHGCAKSTIQEAFGARKRGGLGKLKPDSPPGSKSGRSLAEFRQAYDKDYIVPRAIKAALKTLGAGWEYESAFAKLAGVSLADLGNYRTQFVDYVVPLKDSRRAWAGTPSTAKTMKGML